MNLPELLQRLDADARIELFEVDTTPIGGDDHFYFHAGTNALREAVVWQGTTYQPWPVQADGFDKTAKGSLPRPSLRIANIAGVMYPVLSAYDDLVGAKIIRRQTFAMFLDGQPTADAMQHLPDDVFYIERKVSANHLLVEFELASALDLQGVRLPFRIIAVNSCPWEYKSAECSYTGTNYFDVSDQSTTEALDVCSKKVTGCKARFGAKQRLPFGGFPAARTYKV